MYVRKILKQSLPEFVEMNCSVSLNFTFPERIRISLLNFLLHDADTAFRSRFIHLLSISILYFEFLQDAQDFDGFDSKFCNFDGETLFTESKLSSVVALRLDSLHCLASILEHRRNSKNKNYTFVRPVCLGGRLGSCFHTPASVASQARQSVIDLIHSSISRPLCPTFVSKPQKPKHAFRDNR